MPLREPPCRQSPYIAIQSQAFVLPFGLRDMSAFPSVLRKRSPSVLVAIPSVQIYSYPRCYPQHKLTCLPQCCIIPFTSRPGCSPFVDASVLQYISFYFVRKLEVTPLQALFDRNLFFSNASCPYPIPASSCNFSQFALHFSRGDVVDVDVLLETSLVVGS